MNKLDSVTAAERRCYIEKGKEQPISSYFGEDTFNINVMKEKLPGDILEKFSSIINEDKQLDLDTANAVAHAMKEWAIAAGATHFAHWFQPMTGSTAEKHDAFIEFNEDGNIIERFSGKQLVQGEPDASSFPSGGLRSTFEARGYTAWDMSSPAFLRRNGIGITLCIPTVFISYTGEALDKKTPLLRSIRAVNESSVRMLRLLGNNEVTRVISNLGPEQEYFLIDKAHFYRREDLVLAGRALLGAPPARGQQLDDQYFGSILERVQSYMHSVEEELYSLGIPAKTRHNEVAPSQFEIAPIFEEANIAVDHNQLVMDTMKKVARKHNFVVLFNEKPFAGINGSGKHLNWSLAEVNGSNLFRPGSTPSDNIQFLVFLVAAIKAVYNHADLLRASVASSGNDHRLGANEAPPAIISVFLGEQLTRILEDIESGKASSATDEAIIDLGLSSLPLLSKDNTDRNRTSPFAFTGNKFEFRAVGSSQSISFPATVLNTIIAESLDQLAEKIKGSGEKNIKHAVIKVVRDELKEIKKVLFMGDNYSKEWEEEAERRGLPNMKTTPEALEAFVTEKAYRVFENYKVLSNVELESRYRIRLEKYATELDIEARSLYNLVMTQIYPAAVKYQKVLAESLEKSLCVLGDNDYLTSQKVYLNEYCVLLGKIKLTADDLKLEVQNAAAIEDEKELAVHYCSKVKEKMNLIREYVDEIESYVDNEMWPIPKFWEMLFIS